jgi:hypothetical protein
MVLWRGATTKANTKALTQAPVVILEIAALIVADIFP